MYNEQVLRELRCKEQRAENVDKGIEESEEHSL